MEVKVTESERRFGRFFYRTMLAWGPLLTFRRTAAAGLQAALPRLQQDAEKAAGWLIGGEMDHIFLDKPGFLAAHGPAQLADHHLRSTLEDFTATVDAASIVFAHSILDDLAMEAVGVAFAHAPEVFDARAGLAGKTVKIGDARARGIEALADEKRAEWKEQLVRESVLRKLDVLFEICRPGADFRPLQSDYQYDRSRVEAFDTARHHVVHDLKAPALTGAKLDMEIAYLGDTSRCLGVLLNRRFGLRVDPQRMQEDVAGKE